MKRLLTLALLLGLFGIDARAQLKAGRNGGSFLEIGVGAREAALGSAASSLGDGANQIFWNPGGTALSADQRLSAVFSYNSWIADLTYNAAAVGYNVNGIGTVTLGAQVFGLSDIPANRENEYGVPELDDLVTDTETSSVFDYQDVAVSIGFSRYFFDRLSLGAAFKYVNETIDGVGASALAFDFGSVYRIGFSGWQIAARLSNLGSPMEFYNQDNPLPLTFSIGTSIYPVNSERARVMLAMDATKPLDSRQLLFGGAEISFYDLLFLRGGYKFNYSGATDGGTASRDAVDTSIEGLNLGAGLQYTVSGYAIGVDYAFTSMELLNDSHRFTLRLGM